MTLLPKRIPFRSRKYLDSFKGTSCFICGNDDGTIVGAHIRPGWYGQSKPHDYWVIGLCRRCHEEEGSGPKKFWLKHGYTISEIKKIARERYETWRDG